MLQIKFITWAFSYFSKK